MTRSDRRLASSRPITSRRGRGSKWQPRVRRGWLLWMLALGGLSTSSAWAQDFDGDGVADGADNCTTRANASQVDTNADGYGNECDADWNNDGIVGTPDHLLLGQHFGHQGIHPIDFDISRNGLGGVGAPSLLLFAQYWAKPPGPSHETAPVAGPPLTLSGLPNLAPTSHEFPEGSDAQDPPSLLTYHLDACSAVYRATGLPLVGGCAVSNDPVEFDSEGN